jgi:hypothetical protein
MKEGPYDAWQGDRLFRCNSFSFHVVLFFYSAKNAYSEKSVQDETPAGLGF